MLIMYIWLFRWFVEILFLIDSYTYVIERTLFISFKGRIILNNVVSVK